MNPENTLSQQLPPQGWQQPNLVHPQPQGAINGNYQQQMTSGISAMTINTAKQNLPSMPGILQQQGIPQQQGIDFNQPQTMHSKQNIPSTNGVGSLIPNNNINLSNNNGPPISGFQIGTNAPTQIPPLQSIQGGINTSQPQQILANLQDRNTIPGQYHMPTGSNVPLMKENVSPSMAFQNSNQTNASPMMPPPISSNQQFPVSVLNAPGYPTASNSNQRQLPPPGVSNANPGTQQQTMYTNQPSIPGMAPRAMQQSVGPSIQPPQPGASGMYNQQMGYPQSNFQQQANIPPHPGMPPQQGQFPGKGYQPPGMYNAPVPGQYPQPAIQQQRRLDPDQMPNPIQVMVENQRTSGGLFVSNQAGLLPPLVTTKYVAQDQGNSSPRFLRSSLYSVPATADLLKQTALPFTLLISPFATVLEREITPPIVDFGELGPVRCLRCKAYMSPNMQFIDAGRRFQCLLCKANTEVPTEYFQHLDHTGQRIDKYERPELVLGTYEFFATKDYCREGIPPTSPAFVFVIDVSYNNVKSGLIHLLCREIRQIIQQFPVDQGEEKTKMKVGFITYNNTVHFYNLKSTLAQPQMMVVGDLQDMFMPLLDGFLVDPEESSVLIDALMEQIPAMFGDTKETETILLPAIQAGLEALKASNCTGKLLVFNSSLPIAEAPGKLKNRDDRKILGTEKEKAILVPQCTNYNDLGRDCVQAGCSVDLFIFNNSYVDIATIGQVSRLTGGEVYKYTYFQADIDGHRVIEDIIKNVSRQIAFDAVMRVRTSAGIRPTDFYGHFFMSNTTDMELASIDSGKAVAIEIKHDDKLSPEENIYIQVALLYTSCGGQRRLRIMNLALKSTIQIADVFKSCDLDAIILFFAKQSMFKLMELTPKAVKDNLIHRSAQVLACYRKNCTSPTSAGQLILPECLKLLPLYISCMIKNDAFSGGSDMTCDDRSFVMQFVLAMDLPMSVFYFYPRLIPVHNVETDETDIPLPIRCTYEKMSEDGAYILENGIHMFLWLGLSLPPDFLQPLFGVQCTQQVNTDQFSLPISEAPMSKRIRQIIESIKMERTRYMRITLVKQGDKMENVFRHFLVEDRGADGSASYVDFLCHMHKEIKDLLS